jgi:hypothetical protein
MMILVEKKVSYTWIHNHKKEPSTLSYVVLVKENDYLTLKRALKNVATKKSRRSLLQICRNSKTEKPT